MALGNGCDVTNSVYQCPLLISKTVFKQCVRNLLKCDFVIHMVRLLAIIRFITALNQIRHVFTITVSIIGSYSHVIPFLQLMPFGKIFFIIISMIFFADI